MKKKRIAFIIIWSILSVAGIYLCNFVFIYDYSLVLELFFGFHYPIYAIPLFMYFAVRSDYPLVGLLLLLLFVCFIICWSIALFKIKKSRIFERLIVVDRVLSLIAFFGTALVLQDDFAGTDALICLVIENLIMFSILFILKKRKKKDELLKAKT